MTMALKLGELWPPDLSRSAPGMEREEEALWRLFLDGFGDSYQGFYYNVKLGEARIKPEERGDKIAEMQEDIALQRIDAVGRRGNVWDIFEVRRHAGPGTMGQLLQYETLWAAYAAGNRPYTLNIVTDYMNVDTQLAARERGITIFVV